MKFLTSLDLQNNSLLNAGLQVLSTAPTSPFNGQIYYNSTTGSIGYYSSGLAAWQYDKPSLNALNTIGVPVAAVSLNSQKITNLALGVNPTDAASLQNITNATDALLGGLLYKTYVRSVFTSNVSLTACTSSNDSLTIVVGDRILLTAQTTATQNGPYTYGTAGALTRVGDALSNYELEEASTWVVAEGTSGLNQIWRISTTGTITMGTTAVTIVVISQAGTIYYAATNGGLVLTGTTFAVQKTVGNVAYVPFVYSVAVGNGSSTSIVVTHGLNSRALSYSVVDTSYNAVQCEVQFTSLTTATLAFTSAPASAAYVATFIG